MTETVAPPGATALLGRRPAVRSLADAGLVALLAVVAAYFLSFPVWRSQFLIEIWFTEGWNAYFQDAAARGESIYPAASSLLVNNYPPLSFYAVGLMSGLLGDSLFVGRALSISALIVTAIEVFACTRVLAGGRTGPLIGALWYVAIMSHNFTSYVGVNDPQLAGEAIMGAGLYWFLARERSGGAVLMPLLVMVLGGFWKHNMIAIPLAAIGWLLLRRGRAAVRPVALSVAAACAGLLACAWVFGPAFFWNLFVDRHYSPVHVLGNLGHLQWSALALVIWLVWLSRARTAAAGFTSLHVPIALLSCILQWCGDKIFGNAEFDLMLALGIAVGVAFEQIRWSPVSPYLGITGSRIVLVSLLVARLLATDRQEPLLALFDPVFRAQFTTAEQTVRAEAAEVAVIDGAVACEVKIVCRAAGKPFVADDFKIEQMLAVGTISQGELDVLLREHNITLFKHRYSIIDTSLSHALSRTP